MSPRARLRSRVAVALVAVSSVAAGTVWLASSAGEDGAAPPSAAGAPSAAAGATPTTSPASDLSLSLRHLTGRRIVPGSVRATRLRAPAAAVRDVMTELYTIGFVDRERWAGGRFEGVEDAFVLRTRAKVRRDLVDLTIGPLLARRLDAVLPRASTLDVRFLVDRFPVVAVATVAFRGTAIASGAELPVRHDGTYTLRRVDGRWKIASYRVRSRLPSVDDVEREAREAAGSPDLAATGPYFVLAIGSDARPGQGPSGTRADSLHIVGVNPARRAVSILGIPRDSYVPIPGVGTRKINEALVRGGPALVVRTVEALSGVPIDGYVLTGFAGLRNLVNAIGGVAIRIPYRMNDPFSGARFEPGPTRLTGRRALAFARDRKDVPGGDFGRSLNQGRLLVAAFRELRSDVARDPMALLEWIAAGERILRTDLGLGEIADLLLAVPSIDPARVRNRVVPGSVGTAGGLSIVRLGAGARALFRDLAADGVLDGRPRP